MAPLGLKAYMKKSCLVPSQVTSQVCVYVVVICCRDMRVDHGRVGSHRLESLLLKVLRDNSGAGCYAGH